MHDIVPRKCAWFHGRKGREVSWKPGLPRVPPWDHDYRELELLVQHSGDGGGISSS